MPTHPVTIRAAWHRALYGPAGFYRTPGAPDAHFATSAQGLPGVDVLLAKAIDAYADRLGLRTIVDFAAGSGRLVSLLHQLDPGRTLIGCDVTPRPPDLAPAIGWTVSPGGAELPPELTGLRGTLVVAHEWLDVVPCTVATFRDGALRELALDGVGEPVDTADLQWCQRYWPGWDTEDSVVEIGRARDEAFVELLGRVADGTVLAIDYGHLRDHRPTGGTLTGYAHGQQCPPAYDGSTDVTAHVAMDSLGAPNLRRQREALLDLLPPPTAPAHDRAHTDPAGYLQALAERSAWATATDPDGLGGFWWASRTISQSHAAHR